MTEFGEFPPEDEGTSIGSNGRKSRRKKFSRHRQFLALNCRLSDAV